MSRASAATRSPIRSSVTGRWTSCSCTGGCARSSPDGSGPRSRRSTERLSGMGRLILFDKRGTGLSDRVLGIASLEERMDDVRAVMDAAAVERAAVVGVSEGGPMCALFAATHPDRTRALVTMGSYARRNWAPDYPIGRRPEQDTWLRPTAEQWGEYAARRFLAERAPSIADDQAAIDWYTSYLVRGASPSAVAAITDMNEEIDVRPVLPTVRVPALVLHREDEYLRDASRYMGERLPGAQVVEVPGVDHLPWEGDQKAVLDQIELFLGGLRRGAGGPGPGADDRARGRPPAVGVAPAGLGAQPLPRARARAGRPRPGRARELRRPGARAALRARAGRQRAGAAGRDPHRRVRAARRHARPAPRWRSRPTWPGPRSPARSSPPRRCRTSSRAPGSTSTSAARSATCACSACCADERAVSSTSRGCARPRRSGARRSATTRTPGRLRARAATARSLASPASSQRPSGDHSRSSRRPCAPRRARCRARGSRSASPRWTASARRRRRVRGGEQVAVERRRRVVAPVAKSWIVPWRRPAISSLRPSADQASWRTPPLR